MSHKEEKNVQNAGKKLADSIDRAEEKEVIENMRKNKKNLKGLVAVVILMIIVGFAALVTLKDTVKIPGVNSSPVVTEKVVEVVSDTTAEAAVK